MYNKKTMTCIVAVRAGSKRVENKNFKKFHEKTLLHYKIETLKKSKHIDNIIINSDSERAREIAEELGVVFQKRDDKYATDVVSGSDFFQYLSTCTDDEYIIYSPVTSPLITEVEIDELIEKFFNEEGYDSLNSFDSLNSCNEVKEFMWLDGKPINYDPLDAPNSQNLPDILAINFAFNIIKRNVLNEKKNIIGYKPLLISIDEVAGVDIDTVLDFEIAEYLFTKRETSNKEE